MRTGPSPQRGNELIDTIKRRTKSQAGAIGESNVSSAYLVISDVNMPVMDGITLLKEIKANPNYKFTPVIMLTTEAGEDKKQEGRAAGAKAWITKPFQPQLLVDAVSKLIMA